MLKALMKQATIQRQDYNTGNSATMDFYLNGVD